MNILDKIVVRKKEEISQRKAERSEDSLRKSLLFERSTFSLSEELIKKQPAIIAEFKRKSPSKGIINAEADVQQTTTGYVQAGAAALSVLTDIDFFNGSDENLQIARKHNDCPILRKDFTIDPYQITEAKALGADAILLIAAILRPEEVKQLAAYARALGLEVLLEVHNAEELQQTALDPQIVPYLNVVGVNNRNLKTFEVSIQTSIDLAQMMPKDTVKISESGISDAENIRILTEHGYQGFLVGEYFMKQADPAAACQALIQQI
ncbi:indole-3-glycerol phosphate synthase TrpC [Catalinimonas niigatensis]|uniref:indole-3-glycerol phosphate synthase TrpC n=1 Tax=Catalinimonas niigatensis TaxID=1397264 RepID=UPI00266607F0|nr:indole-3-glycerol phosphate synthase TrpC [Catalinimonas niigatensis]WPP52957.1 indole-3-glycerol phosphate synthase TrpC [Catalinimonas niigatensis]